MASYEFVPRSRGSANITERPIGTPVANWYCQSLADQQAGPGSGPCGSMAGVGAVGGPAKLPDMWPAHTARTPALCGPPPTPRPGVFVLGRGAGRPLSAGLDGLVGGRSAPRVPRNSPARYRAEKSDRDCPRG